MKTQKPTLLLQSCCGPCSTTAIKRLENEFDVTLYFWGNNIFPEEEFVKRLEAQKIVNKEFLKDKPIVVVDYDQTNFLSQVVGLENEPEGGKRCDKCFELRMFACADYAKEHGFDYFASTLSVSPHKDSKKVESIGKKAMEKFGVNFLWKDFKKQDGFLQSTLLSKELGIYRQNYCGCAFSLKNRTNKTIEH